MKKTIFVWKIPLLIDWSEIFHSWASTHKQCQPVRGVRTSFTSSQHRIIVYRYFQLWVLAFIATNLVLLPPYWHMAGCDDHTVTLDYIEKAFALTAVKALYTDLDCSIQSFRDRQIALLLFDVFAADTTSKPANLLMVVRSPAALAGPEIGKYKSG